MSTNQAFNQLLTLNYFSAIVKRPKQSHIPNRLVLTKVSNPIKKKNFFVAWSIRLIWINIGFILASLLLVPVAYKLGYRSGAEVGSQITSHFEPELDK